MHPTLVSSGEVQQIAKGKNAQKTTVKAPLLTKRNTPSAVPGNARDSCSHEKGLSAIIEEMYPKSTAGT
ncbi:hypothetical protein GN244_ATG05895 [Phytophthora infestans]|uniref:Uncharacterized protein n=1 Tax=Phytophthora infestans TaxID=4787 RepID=A0A833T3Q5_PHYIN|nr:hypothetical protein GN244_ATG05895 [Phytophthora infestans]KAF4130509.1 hypothetical protein GN958_ATG20311 [Phytophthora infestans]